MSDGGESFISQSMIRRVDKLENYLRIYLVNVYHNIKKNTRLKKGFFLLFVICIYAVCQKSINANFSLDFRVDMLEMKGA